MTRGDVETDRRLLRGSLLGTSVLVITLAGHAAGGGHLPSFGYYVALLPLAIALSMAASARRRSPLTLIALAIGMQALLHALLVVIGAHGMHGVRLLPDTSMLVVHLGAAVLVGWALAHGDALLDRWLGFWRTFAAGALESWEPRILSASPVAPQPSALTTCFAVPDSIIRRGPPQHS